MAYLGHHPNPRCVLLAALFCCVLAPSASAARALVVDTNEQHGRALSGIDCSAYKMTSEKQANEVGGQL